MIKININAVIYLIGFLLISIEIIFQLIGKTLCITEGCRVVESFVKGGDILLLILGLILFSILFFLSLNKLLERFRIIKEYMHSLVLIMALSGQGYLLSFQSFVVKEFCVFCITVFTVLFISCILRLLQKRLELAFAFTSFLSVFLITYFVNLEIGRIPSSQYVLVYSKDCPHCEEVIQFCKSHSISVQTVEAKNLRSTLQSLKIEAVPVLFCDEGGTKKFIIGQDNIKQYLLTKASQYNSDGGFCPIFNSKNPGCP